MLQFIFGAAFGLGVASLIVAAIKWEQLPKKPFRPPDQDDGWNLFDKATHKPEYDWGYLAWGLFLCAGAVVTAVGST